MDRPKDIRADKQAGWPTDRQRQTVNREVIPICEPVFADDITTER